jgi:putative flippase GtrA
VGGIAAIVEWVMFFLFNSVVGLNYLLATVIAFIFSTTANWILGRIMTFRNSTKYNGKAAKEAILVFIVSAIGLPFNLGLMYLFVNKLGMNTDLLRTLSKILSTGIVFMWNFLARKFVIYNE